MLIPIIWSVVVCLITGTAVYCNCRYANEYEAGFFICILAIGWAFVSLMLCLAAGM